MSLSDNDGGNNVFVRHFQSQQAHNKRPPSMQKTAAHSSSSSSNSNSSKDDSFSPATVSWPILLAIIPTLGAFVAGSTEIWTDFIMLLLILFYVYKWMTVPWAYYESARTRRMIHQQSATDKTTTTKAGLLNTAENEAYQRRMQQEHYRRQLVTAELRRHEIAGLVWVVMSPAIAGYTLQYSRYLLSNVDRYISAFNVTVFVLAASIKPISHVMMLLQERTVFLQSEASITDGQVHALQNKLEMLEKELYSLRKAFATKRDLGQVTEGIHPTLQTIAKALKRSEKRDQLLRSWSEQQFSDISKKVREFDQYVCYRIEQDQRQQAHGMVVSLILLPLNISLWVVKRMTRWLPIHHDKHLLAASSSSSSPPSPVATPPTSTKTTIKPLMPRSVSSRQHRTGAFPDPTESSYSTEGSIAAFGR